MWERSLQDLIRGLRSHKTSSKLELDAFIEEALKEIRVELKGNDMELKAEGVMKMCYLMMLYPIPPPPSFAFHVVEVMSSPRYHLKQLGYIAAPMAFSSETEEVVLTVNGIRKDLLSPNASLPPLALAGLSDIINSSLAREVHQDVITLLSHSRPQVRKRAVLAIFKICEKYPDALHSAFARLRERLEDDDPGVVSATVNVICELSRRSNPANYLPLAPQLFAILTTSSNNWMLIKIVKLFATLTPIEPRLVRKLLPPLTNLISTTPAISLLYECVRTCIVGGMLDQSEAGDALAKVCVEKLSTFLSDEDQNLKYIALLAMVKIVPSHPHLVVDYQDEILQSVDDADVSIRMRALELTSAMVNPHNVREIVTQLLSHLVPPTTAAALPSAISSLQTRTDGESLPGITSSPASVVVSPAYRLEVVRRILQITSLDTYANITDFEWYMSVLIDLTYVSNVDVGQQISDIILDVVARVRSVRKMAVALLARLLEDTSFLDNLGEEAYCAEVLYAAAWVCGEYSSNLYDPKATISSLFQPATHKLSPRTIAVYISSATKIFGTWAASVSESWSAEAHADVKAVVKTAVDALLSLGDGMELEVQERSANSLQLFRFVQADLDAHQPPTRESSVPEMPNGFRNETADEPSYPKSLFLIKPLFSGYEMNPVGYRAQESVKVPDGLDLGAVLVPQAATVGAEDKDDEGALTSEDEVNLGEGGGKGMEELRRVLRATEGKAKKKKLKKDGGEETPEERLARKAARRAKRKGDPYYLDAKDDNDIDSIPIVKLELDDEPSTSALRSSRSGKRNKTTSPLLKPDIDRQGEMPEGSPATVTQVHQSAKGKQKATNGNEGLQGIDLTGSTNGPAPPTSHGRYEEYKMDDEVAPVGTDQPAEQSAKIEVVKVKKKKKKPTPIAG